MEGRRRTTLYDQMTAGDETSGSRSSLSSLIFNDVVSANRNIAGAEAEAEAEAAAAAAVSRNRTLSDIIREDEPNNIKDRRSWKAFKDKLWLKRASGSTWPSSIQNDEDSHNRASSQSSGRNSVSFQTLLDLVDSDESTNQTRNDVIHDEVDNSRWSSSGYMPPADNADSSSEVATTSAVVSMSLMELLEEAEVDFEQVSDDDNDDADVIEYKKQGEGGEEGEGELERVDETGVVAYSCCVCMVRHKGAAFIPCGHTFCRMCSRELWVNRGNCPLCNNFILEILDIF